MTTKKSFLFAFMCMIAACDGAVNAPVIVEDGARDVHATQTVNGVIRVGNDATVTSGSFRTVNGSARVGDNSVVPAISVVNGSITIGESSRAGELSTVNGSITLGDGSIARGLNAVNGVIRLGQGVVVDGDVASVNGSIKLDDGVHVRGGLANISGGMTIGTGAVVDGGLVVTRPRGAITVEERPMIVIGRDARIDGELRFEREVELRIHRSATVGGIVGADPVMFDDD